MAFRNRAKGSGAIQRIRAATPVTVLLWDLDPAVLTTSMRR